jgi:lactate dehydrogenase-like 2-hydroxyacid dehydrogenase
MPSITVRQAYFTDAVLTSIAETTIANLTAFEQDAPPLNEVAADRIK